MTAAVFSIVGGNANHGRREPAYATPQPVRLVVKILKLAQRLWRDSPQKGLARAAGVSPRSVEYWSAGRGLSSDALANLIRSEEGFHILELVMDESAPRWWRICRPLMRVAEVQQMQEIARRKLRRAVQGALDADQSISASIARAESALSVQDEDFAGAQFDGYRAAGRVAHRAVGQTKGGR